MSKKRFSLRNYGDHDTIAAEDVQRPWVYVALREVRSRVPFDQLKLLKEYFSHAPFAKFTT